MASCAACKESLTATVELDTGDDQNSGDEPMAATSGTAAVTETVPDGVELSCGCHFHWFAIQGLEMNSN